MDGMKNIMRTLARPFEVFIAWLALRWLFNEVAFCKGIVLRRKISA